MDKEYKTMCVTLMFWAVILFVLMLLGGCARHATSPATTINDGLQQDVAQLIDYANNNMADDPDIKLLKTGLKDCAARADAIVQTCNLDAEKCDAEKGKLRTERNALAVVLIFLLLYVAGRPIRKVLGL